jgi:hypothetical protein
VVLAQQVDRHAHDQLERRCTAHKRSGGRCKNAALRDTTVSGYPGGRASQVKRKARQRIEEAAERMTRELLKIATDNTVSDSVRLAAIRDALDRAGLSAKTAVEVGVAVKPWESVIEGFTEIVSGSVCGIPSIPRIPDDSGAEHPPALASGSPKCTLLACVTPTLSQTMARRRIQASGTAGLQSGATGSRTDDAGRRRRRTGSDAPGSRSDARSARASH